MEINSKVPVILKNGLNKECVRIPIVDWFLNIKTISEANNSDHWTKKAKRHKSQKLSICNQWLSYKPHIQLPLPCTVVLTRIAPRNLDSDNLQMSMKYIRDSIADIIIPLKKAGQADSSPFITWIYQQKKGEVRQYAVKIQIFDDVHFNPDYVSDDHC